MWANYQPWHYNRANKWHSKEVLSLLSNFLLSTFFVLYTSINIRFILLTQCLIMFCGTKIYKITFFCTLYLKDEQSCGKIWSNEYINTIALIHGHSLCIEWNRFTLGSQALVARTTPSSNFLLTNLFSIKFLYYFIISPLFPYFNLFVSIFMQSYVDIKLHVSTLYRY